MGEHTPTPWGASHCDDGTWMVHTEGDVLFVSNIIGLSDPDSRSQEANAAFIVKCVNSHDALVKALENIAIYGCGMLSQPPAMNGPEESWLRMRIAEYERCAREALRSVAPDTAEPDSKP